MSEQPWTIDAIAHALPHPATRMQFLTEVNLAPVDQLPDVITKWVQFIQRWEAGRPHAEQLRAHLRDHGQLPADYQAACLDVTDQVLADADRARRGAA